MGEVAFISIESDLERKCTLFSMIRRTLFRPHIDCEKIVELAVRKETIRSTGNQQGLLILIEIPKNIYS